MSIQDDRHVITVYKLGNESFSVIAEDDSTPVAAWPDYLVRIFADWIADPSQSLRPRRLLNGEMVLEEHHDGVISHVSDSTVTVRYGSGDDEFEVEYPHSQFENAEVLNRGDKIEAVIGLLRVPRPTVSLDSLYTAGEQQALEAELQNRKVMASDLRL